MPRGGWSLGLSPSEYGRCLVLGRGSGRVSGWRNTDYPSGRLQTIALKATPTADVPKVAGASKGSWGKPGPKAAAAAATTAAATATAATAQGESVNEDGVRTKTYLSNSTAGFEIPVTTNMHEVDKI